jgi:hypothetical protein
MKHFYVNDLTKLKDYGFWLTERHEYWLRCKRALNIIVQEDSGMMTFYSPSRDAIAIVCEMYQKGIIEILDDCETATYNMKVTEDEMKLIYRLRKENEKKST